MRGIYMDNAATAFPKAPGVAKNIFDYLTNIGCNINRGSYDISDKAENIVYETRELICKFFNFNKPENIIFTKNITESLNILIKGLLKDGDHVIVSSMEHNAVMRPLNSICKNNAVKFSRVICNKNGQLPLEDLDKYLKPNTKAIIMTCVSNVCGSILPIKEVGKFCRKNNLFFIIDSAQSAGILDMDINELNADAIAFTGHKGLLGPQGIGGFVIKDELAKNIYSLIEGGTGSFSESEKQPQYMPDKFESGTMNIPGIFGLNASLKYLFKIGVNTIYEKERFLTDIFINETKNIKGINLIGLDNKEKRIGVVSLDFKDFDNGEISYILSNKFHIMTRCGLHCAPYAHKTLGTFPKGTVRFSFGYFNTVEEINYVIDSINKSVKV